MRGVDLAFLAHTGLAKMAALDPTVVIKRTDDQIRLFTNGQKVSSLAIPQSNHPEEWARVTMQTIALGTQPTRHVLQGATWDEITHPYFQRYD